MAGAGLHRLTAMQVQKLRKPGRHADGGGLYLVIDDKGNRKWVLRVQSNGRRRDFGLGSAVHVPLAEAREGARTIRAQLRGGLDPVLERKKARNVIPTFREAAIQVHKENEPTWRNPKHAAQWLTTLETYAFPKLGDHRIDLVDGPMVRDALLDIWLTIPETARRVRQRIGMVLDWGHANGLRETPSPTRNLGKSLPRQPKADEHYAALPWSDVPVFIKNLHSKSTAGEPARLLLEFVILTAVRSGEARQSEWSEFDLEERTWTIPADRMKAGKPHVVPLTDRAVEILNRMLELRRVEDQSLVFEGQKPERPMSDMTLTQVLRRMEVNATVHGFRSSFRDWAAETTSFPREVAEQALAHVIESKVERAYRRSDLLEKRRELMGAWASFLIGANGNVVPISEHRRTST